MTIKMLIAGSLTALALGATAAQADDTLPVGSLDAVLERGAAYGFTHYLEIEAKERGQVEIEGWLDDEWQAEVRLSLESGELFKESRKRKDDSPWGMSEAEVRLAMEVAVAEGMVEFEEVEIKRDDLIEIEGRDEDGRELEVTTRQGAEEAERVERD
ncbi:PepSY domain-containing protein [Halomonas sp. C05BenzN]|uniref:PepSY domain-containing protein n=1 Tax=Halomonas sp. C05BenzN TaxID=3411041 RepID=UPI003B93CCFD